MEDFSGLVTQRKCCNCCDCIWQGHFSAVTSLSLASDRWTLLSGGRDKVAHLWDLRHHTKLVTVPVYEALEGMMHVD